MTNQAEFLRQAEFGRAFDVEGNRELLARPAQ